jgi:hypothetical protein
VLYFPPMTKKTLLTILGVLVVITTLGFVIAQSFFTESALNSEPSPVAQQLDAEESTPAAQLDQAVTADSATVQPIAITATQSGQTAFDLLQASADVKFQQYDFGVFITEINGVAGDTQHFWALYVNDQMSQTGADQTVLEPGDVVEFHYDKMQ